MSSRSWMAALTLAAGLAAAVAARPDDRKETVATTPTPKAAPATRETDPTPATAATYRVRLALSIAGLTPSGCDVEIKPAHPGCTFKPRVEHIGPGGQATLDIDGIQTVSADRDCSFAITMREPGQTPHTTYRGLRLSTRKTPGGTQFFECILNSPSRLARLSATDKKESTRR